MAIIVEDGTGVTDANSYCTIDEVIDYGLQRGFEPDGDAAEIAIYKAMDFLETQNFKGEKVSDTQPLQWPRNIVDPCTGEQLYPNDSIPADLKKAQLELALQSAKGVDLMPVRESGKASLKKQKVGPIEREFYDDANATSAPRLPLASKLLFPFLLNNVGTGFALRTVRA